METTLLLILLAGPAFPQSRGPLPALKQAESYLRQQQYRPAATLLQQVLKKSPRNPLAQNLMGLALTGLGKPEEANIHFQAAVKSNPKFYPAWKNLALNELAMRRWEEARGHFQQVLTYAPDDAVAHLSLGEIHYMQREFGPAVDEYLKSEGLFLRDPRLVLNFARSCFESNQPQKAAGALEILGPEADGQAHFQAGLMLAQMEKYAAAAHQFELATKDYPDPYEAGFNLTLAYVRSQNYSAAIQAAQKLIAQNYRNAELYNLLAEAYEHNNQTIEAYNALRTATQLDPKDENNYLDLMALGVDHANYELALDIANIALNNIPNSFRLIMQRGAVLAFQGRLTPALEDFDRAAQLDPQSNLPYFAMCMAPMQTAQVPRALEILRKRLAARPDDYLLLYALGESADRSAGSGLVSQDEALRALEKSVQANPNLSTSRIALGRIYLRRNEVDLAIPQLQRALELDPTDLSPCYQLAQAYLRKGDKQRAEDLMAKFTKFRDEDRERHINRNLLKLLREGEK
ncbi:MAG: tetratricopeptide repeat protein [Acidobacteriia bacterium]|nr:tetratricopeptide repeat protein [Terriglobia bacterium]